MEKKSIFLIMDEMNQDDTKNGTALLGLSTTVIAADKVKQGTAVKMGAPAETVFDLMTDKVMCILLIINKDEFYRRQKEAENAAKTRENPGV